MHPDDVWLLTVLLWLGLPWLIVYLSREWPSVSFRSTRPKRVPKPLTPRPPDDCPECQMDPVCSVGLERAEPPPPPWLAVKSPRGRPKSIETAGYACLNPECRHRLLTDAHLHALVGDGTHAARTGAFGGRDRIQDLVCQACGHKFSVRRDTALYRLRTRAQIVAMVLALLAEGCGLDALQRVFGLREATLRLWLMRAGLHAQTLHDHFSHGLQLGHLQLDELFTTVRQAAHEVWLWVALDATTKFIPTLILGPRTQDMAHQLIHRLRRTLAETCLPVFSSDGLKLYFYALTAHFGQWLPDAGQAKRIWCALPGLLYAQVQKIQRRRRLMRVNHQMLCGSAEAFSIRLQSLGLSGRIQTAFIERVNLTLRRSLASLARRSWSLAHLPGELHLHLEWWRAYYHFVRPHRALRQKLDHPRPRGGRRLAQHFAARTPAMAVGFTQHPWSVLEVLSFPLPNNC
jgi:IS1 family transposase